MNLAVVFIIFSMFGTVFDGGELCFSGDGDVHLSCCCKKVAAIKQPCCGSHCRTVSFPSLDVASNQLRIEADANVGKEEPSNFKAPEITFNLKSFIFNAYHPLSGDRSYLSLKLAKAVFRC